MSTLADHLSIMLKSTTRTGTATATATTATRQVVRRSPSQDNQVVVALRHLLQNRLLRWVTLHIPMLFILSLAILSHSLLKIQRRYIHPYLQSLEFTEQRAEWEETYPRMECQSSDLSTADPRDLFLRNDSSVVEAVDKTLLHGAVALPQIMNASVATKLRTYILKRNKELRADEEIDVISNQNRISFALLANEHKSVSEALQAIGRNELFSETLETLLGPDPALMELHVITTEHAQTQYWHADTIPGGSAIRYARTFVPVYTLIIPLQDTDKDMGKYVKQFEPLICLLDHSNTDCYEFRSNCCLPRKSSLLLYRGVFRSEGIGDARWISSGGPRYRCLESWERVVIQQFHATQGDGSCARARESRFDSIVCQST